MCQLIKIVKIYREERKLYVYVYYIQETVYIDL